MRELHVSFIYQVAQPKPTFLISRVDLVRSEYKNLPTTNAYKHPTFRTDRNIKNSMRPVYKNGRIDTQKGITAQNIYKMLSGRVIRAGILKKTTPHDFRRTAISNMFDNGVDASTLSKIVGHSNIATTGKYDRGKLKQRQQAAEGYSISVSLLED